VVITALPIVADLIGRLPVHRWVYYCVDDFGQWPGLDRETLRRMDDELVSKADILVAVSETLQERLAGLGRKSSLLTHGVDLDFWQAKGRPAALPALNGLERPLIVFWGVVDRRMDVAFVRRLAADLSRGTIVLVGPRADADPALLELPRVVSLGPLAFAELPLLAQEANVLIMPYADLPVTRAIQPLKLKEYLATGRPVVVRDLPATRPWGDCLDLVATPEGFSELVRRRAEQGMPLEQTQARSRLAGEGWAEKAHLFEQWALAVEPSQNAVGG
jgi:glycosyltransferase involved in cell wall biosynthesis